MATAINTTTSPSLSDAAVALGKALQVAIGAKDAPLANLLRDALSHLLDAAAEAGGQQLEIDRLTRYTERLEQKNTELAQRLIAIEPFAERMLAELAPALDAVTEAFNRAAQLKSALAGGRQPDRINRGQLSDETLSAVLAAPGMAHGD